MINNSSIFFKDTVYPFSSNQQRARQIDLDIALNVH